MKTIAFFGNCQAKALASVYNDLLGPVTGDQALYVDSQHVDAGGVEQRWLLKQAEIAVVQEFDFPTKLSADDLKPGVKRCGFPLLVGMFYWPYGRASHPLNRSESFMPDGPYPPEIGDAFLSRRLKAAVDPELASKEYEDLDVAKATSLDRLLEMTLSFQRERDRRSGLSIAPYVEANFTSSALFRTPAHPSLDLFRLLARGVFDQIGVPLGTLDRALDRLYESPFSAMEAPIHPSVAAYHGLKFVQPGSAYMYMHEGVFTFEQFIRRYTAYQFNRELQEGIYLSAGPEMERSLELLKRGLVKSPLSCMGWTRLSVLLGASGLLDDAANAAKVAVQCAAREKQRWSALNHLGHALNDAGEIGGSKDAFGRALDMRPSHPDTLNGLADLNLSRGSPEQAIEPLLRLIDMYPADATLRSRAGHAYRASGRLEDAARSFRRAGDLDPAEPDYPLYEAQLLQACGHLCDAEEAFGRALKVSSEKPDLMHVIADLKLQRGLADEAIEVLERIVPASASVHRTMGHAQAAAGRYDLAVDAFRRAIDLDPAEHPDILIALADLNLRKGSPEQAIEPLLRLIDMYPADATLRSRAGHAYRASGRLEDAARSFRRAGDLDPAEPDYPLYEAQLLQACGHLCDAEEAFGRALKVSSEKPDLMHVIADLKLQRGLADEAIEVLERIVPASASVHRTMGHAQAAAGRYDLAVDAFRRAIDLDPAEPDYRACLKSVSARILG